MAKLAVVWTVVAIVSAGCGKDDCERMYEMEQKCSGKEKSPERDFFVMACNAARKSDATKDEVEAEIACAKEDTCEAFKACGKGRRGKARAKEVTTAIEAGKWKDAWDACTLIADYYLDATFKTECAKVFTTGAAKLAGDELERAMYRCKSGTDIKKAAPEFDQACQAMTTGRLTAAIAAATAARDSGKRDFKICFELERLAESVGGDAATAAKTLCKEVEQADDARQAIDEARANAAAKKTDLPFKCQWAADKLAELGTEWSKRTLDELFKACYVELGAIVLDVDPKAARYVCPYQVKRMQEAIAKHDLATKYPELAAALAKLPKKCTK